ncbi:MAG: DUF4349 domain-containing protein [Anaerolineae bacterium]|nr:DUF4349 domain-containing protein [Anaerolineae bacterium]
MNKTRIGAVAMVVTLAALVLGCALRSEAPAIGAPMEEVVRGLSTDADNAHWAAGEEGAKSAQAGMAGVEGIDRKIIYNVSLHLIVKDTEVAFSEVQRLAGEMGGFVSESRVWRTEGHRQATVTVRVPAGDLDDALARFRALALDVESENVDSQDVTEEYVDLEARLTNERRTEAELLELLETRSETGKTQDILEVHRELSSVRSQIESLQGRMRYLENLSDLATVQITLTPDALMQPIDVGGWRPQGTARDAVRMLLRTLQFFADAAIVFGVYILPVLIVIAIPVTIVVLVIRALVRRAKRRKRARAEE